MLSSWNEMDRLSMSLSIRLLGQRYPWKRISSHLKSEDTVMGWVLGAASLWLAHDTLRETGYILQRGRQDSFWSRSRERTEFGGC